MNRELTPLESEVMRAPLEGDDPVLQILREQLSVSCVASREMTGVGFYTTFLLATEATRIQGNKSFRFGDVEAKIKGLQRGAGFVLFVTDGLLDVLEGYTYDEPWPAQVSNFQLRFSGGSERNLAEVRAAWG